MLVVIPFDEAHAPLAVRLLEWCVELTGRSRHPCLLVISRDTPQEIIETVSAIARLAFDRVNIIKPMVDDKHLMPETVNLYFRTAVGYVEKIAKQPFFWLEVDCVPLRMDWIERLEMEYRRHSKPYMGFRRDIPIPHISAPAVYPAKVSHYNPASLRDVKNKHGTLSFDLVDGDRVLKRAHVTKLIHHEYGSKDKPPTFPDRESLDMISKDAVLFHRVKDGSLIDRLREVRQEQREVPPPMQIGTLDAEGKPCVDRIAVVYVYPNMGGNHDVLAKRFIGSYLENFPDTSHELYIVSNGGQPTQTMREILSEVMCRIIIHDDTGWDIGAYQKAALEIPCDLIVFFGGWTYLKGSRWLERMVEAYRKHGAGLYGATGSLGHNIHIRTTGFWMPPGLLNSYPYRVENTKESRYEFEHGNNSITVWAFSLGLKAWMVTWDGEYEWQQWNEIKNGFQTGNQSALLCGDRLTDKPYFG